MSARSLGSNFAGQVPAFEGVELEQILFTVAFCFGLM